MMSDTEGSSDDEGASLFGGNLATLESNAKRHLLELGSALADAPDAPSGAPNLAADEPTLIPIARVSPVSIQNKRDRESHSSVSPPRRQPRVASASPPRLLPTTKAIPPHMPSSLQEHAEVWAKRPWATASRQTMPMPLQEQQVVDANSSGSGSQDWQQSPAPTQMQAQQWSDARSADVGDTLTSPPPPDQASVRLDWAQVKYFQSDTGEWKLDSKNAPCNPPYDGMKFKGYQFPKDRSTVEAFFVRIGASARRPNRTGGGVNKNFHDALAHAKKHGEDIEDLKKRLTYVSKVRRTHGVNDPEI